MRSTQKGGWAQKRQKSSALFVSWLTSHFEVTAQSHLAALPPIHENPSITEISDQSMGPHFPADFHSYFGNVSIGCLTEHVPFKFPRQQGPCGCKQTLWCCPREPLSNTQHDPLTSGALLNIFPSTCSICPPNDLHSDPARGDKKRDGDPCATDGDIGGPVKCSDLPKVTP